jgi:hypothetical protein
VSREARVTSFVVRFVYEEEHDPNHDEAGHWYSVVRHVQSNTEKRFTRWEDVVLFLRQYVDLSKGAKDE